MAKQKEFVKCRYAHCKHESAMIKRDEAVKSGNAFYHQDCYEEKQALHEIERYYIDNFELQPIVAQLRKTINNIIFTKHCDPEFLLFAMRYAKINHVPVKHPAGLYYLIKDDKIVEEWDHYQARKALKEISRSEFAVNEDLTPVSGYGAQKPKGFLGALA